MKAWLKGGLIGLCIGLIFLGLYFIGVSSGIIPCPGEAECTIKYHLGFLMLPSILGALPFTFFVIVIARDVCPITCPILSTISYAICGAIIGLIVGKIKSKRV